MVNFSGKSWFFAPLLLDFYGKKRFLAGDIAEQPPALDIAQILGLESEIDRITLMCLLVP